MKPKRKQDVASKPEKLSFRKTPFRVLDKAEMNEVKGGSAMELANEMVF